MIKEIVQTDEYPYWPSKNSSDMTEDKIQKTQFHRNEVKEVLGVTHAHLDYLGKRYGLRGTYCGRDLYYSREQLLQMMVVRQLREYYERTDGVRVTEQVLKYLMASKDAAIYCKPLLLIEEHVLALDENWHGANFNIAQVLKQLSIGDGGLREGYFAILQPLVNYIPWLIEQAVERGHDGQYWSNRLNGSWK
jgi:hypothetical protein